jgi:2-oxo-4-hydroxy-4-carboxy-5-ureidoimidazoline decarboxylase
MILDELNRLSVAGAEAEFLRCCGSKRWAKMMAKARPFGRYDVLSATAERLWWSLDAADWLEAFAAHPRIGDRPTSAWSAEEQSAASSPTDDVRARLVRGNQQYEMKFGYTFLVCATGQSAVDLLAVLERRLDGRPADELQVAAAEQRKITSLRLEKLLTR